MKLSCVLQGDELRRRLNHEWLLTDGMGGFAMGTVSGIPQRRYHALLIAATKPPVGRVALVQAVADWLVVKAPNKPERRYDLASFEFVDGTISPCGSEHLVGFCGPLQHVDSARHEPASKVFWEYRIRYEGLDFGITRSLTLNRDGSTTLSWSGGEKPCLGCNFWIECRPLLALRDFHELVASGAAPTTVSHDETGFTSTRGDFAVDVFTHDGSAIPDHEVWRSIAYRRDRARGQDFTEHLESPARFRLASNQECLDNDRPWFCSLSFATHTSTVSSPAPIVTAEHISKCVTTPVIQRDLIVAAAQFVATRATPSGPKPSIIAGYPWFSDWGRDTMISLPGLLLCTGRHDEARDTLLAFAGLMKDGLIPNCFDNGSGEAEYNTVDASLWFIQAVCNLAEAAPAPVPPELLTACRAVINAYRSGTRFNIRMDPADGLVMAGDIHTQLTWMDARRDGVVFTPRHGKPVEINALWHSGLMRFARLVGPSHPTEADFLRLLASKVGASFCSAFWNPHDACLFDCLSPNGPSWDADTSIRPNQIFAVSLPYCPLPSDQQRAVVACVKTHLLTPVGLRTLARGSPGYRPRFEGDLFSRDGAYHNGTVWPWLIGAYIEALLRANEFSDAARSEGRAALQPLLDEFSGVGPTSQSIASIAEVYDADELPGQPRRPDGCPMQAWSVAEVLRALTLVSAGAEPISAT